MNGLQQQVSAAGKNDCACRHRRPLGSVIQVIFNAEYALNAQDSNGRGAADDE